MMLNKSLIKGSLVLLIAFNLFNLLNFIFHFSMARLLTVTEFGVLSALFSIIYILSGLSESIQIISTKYSAKEKNNSVMKNFLKRALKKAFLIGIIMFAAYLIIAIFISHLTKINYFLVALTGLIIFSVLLSPISRGVLQGKKRFRDLGINMVAESIIKLVLAVVLVFLGWKVFGAITGALIGTGAGLAGSIVFEILEY